MWSIVDENARTQLLTAASRIDHHQNLVAPPGWICSECVQGAIQRR
jgi:hypothetical protein